MTHVRQRIRIRHRRKPTRRPRKVRIRTRRVR